MQAFISYSRKDTLFVEKFWQNLNRLGLSVIYDKQAIEIGDVLVDSIRDKIDSCPVFLLIVSVNS
ncbi:MAG: toll/interleukin-1 receptor domain-containing protein, partial [Bacteroidota bacterium]